MLKQQHLPIAEVSRSKSGSGQEKFTFFYGAFAAIGVALAVIYSVFAGFSLRNCLWLAIGGAVIGFSLAFSVSELYKAGKAKKAAPTKEEADVYGARPVSIAPPTGDPYPHHEAYTESQGFDQGQLTARIPGSTPFVDALESRKRKPQSARP